MVHDKVHAMVEKSFQNYTVDFVVGLQTHQYRTGISSGEDFDAPLGFAFFRGLWLNMSGDDIGDKL